MAHLNCFIASIKPVVACSCEDVNFMQNLKLKQALFKQIWLCSTSTNSTKKDP